MKGDVYILESKLKLKLNTNWKDGTLVCVCTQDGKCLKKHGCELLDFVIDNSFSANDCMKHTSYNRVKSRMQQRR